MLRSRHGRRGEKAPPAVTVEPPGDPAQAAERAPGRSASGPALVIGLVAAVGLTLWMLAGLWGPGPPSGDDTMAHLVRAEFAIHQLLPRLDGWQPRFGLGYQQFLFYGPGFTWLVAVVHWLGLGALSVAGALKVAAVLAVVALPLATAFLARSFGLDGRAAGLAAILSLCVLSPFGGVGLPGTFGVGLIPNQLGAVLFLLALGGAMRTVADGRGRWVLLTGAALAALLVTHAISAVILAPFLLIVLPTYRLTDLPPARALARLAAAVGLAAGLAAFWLVPALAHRDLRGPLTTFLVNAALPERLDQIVHTSLLFQQGIIWLVLAGWLFGVWRVAHGRSWALGLAAAPLLYLLIADLFLRWNPRNLVSMQLANRGLGYAGLIALLPVAALLSHLAGAWPWRRAWLAGAGALACAVVLVVASGPVRGVVRQQEPTPQLRAMAAELSRVVPPGARFAVQRDFPRELTTAGVSHPDFWLAWASGRNVLNIFNVESSTTPGPDYEPDRITDQPPDQAADTLLRLGVSHIALTYGPAASLMLASPRFRLVWRREPMAVLALLPRPGLPAPGSPLGAGGDAEVRVLGAGPERLEAVVRSDQPTVATAAIAWSPKWHATVDGRPLRPGRSRDGLLTVPLPAGSSRVVLRFRSDDWDRVGVAGTLLTLAALGAWVAWRRRPRGRTRVPTPAEGGGGRPT